MTRPRFLFLTCCSLSAMWLLAASNGNAQQSCDGLQGHFSSKRNTGIGGGACIVCHDFTNGAFDGGPGKNLRWIRTQIEYPIGSGVLHQVKYTQEKSAYPCSDASPCDGTLADGDISKLDGPCEVCHTKTKYHRGTDNGDKPHNDGKHCTDCHSHFSKSSSNWFSPSGGGETFPHLIHRKGIRGPKLDPLMAPAGDQCMNCHGSSDGGGENWRDGATSLETTTVCNPCHSPGGAFDGVNDPVIGVKAKNNWNSDGSSIYEADGKTLKPGKEKWCMGCHDGDPKDPNNLPSNSKRDYQGVFAPSISGDNTKWGYWTSGHGRPSARTRLKEGCAECHDLTKLHIDHKNRTFNIDETQEPPVAANSHRDSFRLIDSFYMDVPRIGRNKNITTDEFEFCTRCHKAVFDTTISNFRRSSTPSPKDWDNLHGIHLDYGYTPTTIAWDADRDDMPARMGVAADSQISCLTCHDPHGTPMNLASSGAPKLEANQVMIRPVLDFRWYTLPDGDGGLGKRTNDIKTSLSGQLIPTKPSCLRACHPGNRAYNRNSKQSIGLVIDDVWLTTSGSNKRETVFSSQDKIQVHATFTVHGPALSYFIQPLATQTKVGSIGKWVKLTKNNLVSNKPWSAQLAPATYANHYIWEINLSNATKIRGENLAQVGLSMSPKPGGTKIDTGKFTVSFKVM